MAKSSFRKYGQIISLITLGPTILFGIIGFLWYQNMREIVQIELSELEIADTNQERSRGLMYRKELCPTCGMLFIFETEQPLSFWMENTYLSLDIIFITQDNRITDVHQNTVPLQRAPTYNSSDPALYALEVPAGYSQKYGINAGKRLNVQDLIAQGKDFRFVEGMVS